MDVHFYSLEPDVMTPKPEGVSIVAEVLLYNPGRHVIKTKIHQQVLLTDCRLEKDKQWHTMLNVDIASINGKRWALEKSDSIVFAQHQQSFDGLFTIIETCSGIGAVGRGFEACEAKTACYNDSNRPFCDWLRRHLTTPCIEGNLTDLQTVQRIHDQVGGPHVVSSGMSCQPFSRFGDRKEASDPRSESFPGTLALAHYLGSLAIILECTTEAASSEWVQTTLNRFALETGYKVSQITMTLHHSWPARRDRWWAVITHPALNFHDIPPMPEMRFDPTVHHLIPGVLDLPPEQLEQLQLDEDELHGFLQCKGGIQSKILNRCKPLPTATHSWGSQLKGCACTCRERGFSSARIEEKGLHGVVVPLTTTSKIKGQSQTNMRHLHPQEVAICNGLYPSHVAPEDEPTLRLMLAGVGQLASPLQGGWILSNLHFQTAQQGLINETKHPRQIFADICEQLLLERDCCWKNTETRYIQIMNQEVASIARPIVFQDPDSFVYSSCTDFSRVHSDDRDVPVGQVDSVGLDLYSSGLVPSAEPTVALPHLSPTEASLPHAVTTAAICTTVDAQQATDEEALTKVPSPAQVFAAHSEATEKSTTVSTTAPPAIEDQVSDQQSEPDSLDLRIALQLAHQAPMDEDERERFETQGALPGFAVKRKLNLPNKEFKRIKTQADEIFPTAPDSPDTEDQAHPIAPADHAMPKGVYTHAVLTAPAAAICRTTDATNVPEATEVPQAPTTAEAKQDPAQVHSNMTFTQISAEDPEDGAPATYLIDVEGSVQHLRIAQQVTGQQVLDAESKFRQIMCNHLCTPVGTAVEPTCQLVPGSFLECWPAEPLMDSTAPVLAQDSRSQLLWKQSGWVAKDEMEFYLNFIESSMPSGTYHMHVMTGMPNQHVQLAQFITSMITQTANDINTQCKCSVILCNQRWIPIMVRATTAQAEVWLPPDAAWIQTEFSRQAGDHEITFAYSYMPHAFANDCGFQAIGWLIATAIQEDTQVPVEPQQACQWRHMFHHNLIHTKQDQTIVWEPLQLGGANPHSQLKQLVTEHGVAPGRAEECASQLIQKLGLSAITQALKSPKPWMDLKAKANLAHPPVKIVMADELQVMISQRAKSGKAVGSKANKLHHKNKPEKSFILKADQLQLPRAVFKQDDGTELGPIQPTQLGPNSQGVALTNIEGAMPFFALQNPLSPHGVGLLVLDIRDERLPPGHTKVKVPVIHAMTQEPMIITAALFQLGTRTVSRNFPANCIQVPQVDTQVVRVQVYRDQTPHNWEELAARPAKTVLEHSPFTDLSTNDVLDVWDRQFVNMKMGRQAAAQASIFLCNIRITTTAAKNLFAQSGQNGQYYEPRSEDGRHPADQQHVVWLPHKLYPEAQLTQRTYENSTLVRQGDRYGIRVPSDDAEKIHTTLRPDIVFLPGKELKKFKVGPWPYGSTKQSLMHVFKQWEWQARPVGPIGQTQDRTGVMWSVHAAQDPSHWIFHLHHGDVLIAPEDRMPTVEPRQAVLASAHTIKQLQRPEAKEEVDPLTHHDPWKDWHKPIQGTKELSVGQLNALQSKLEEKFRTKLTPEDEEMREAVDSRVNALESKLEELTATVGKHHVEQQAQNQATQVQLSHLDQKIDQQHQGLQNMLESKLDQQLQRIEQMFHKRKGMGE